MLTAAGGGAAAGGGGGSSGQVAGLPAEHVVLRPADRNVAELTAHFVQSKGLPQQLQLTLHLVLAHDFLQKLCEFGLAVATRPT